MGTSATSDLIKADLIADIQAANPTVDVIKGPVYDLLLAPVPPVLGEVSDSVTALQNLYSPIVNEDTSNAGLIETLGQAFKVPKQQGTRSRVQLVFWFTSLPQTPITIPAGTAVSTSDRSVIYTTETAVAGISSGIAYRFYNASTSRYEITIPAVASVAGSDQYVPAQRLTTLLSKIPGISGVYNPNASSVGVDAGSTASYLKQIQKRFLGADSSSFTRQLELIEEKYPGTVTDFVLSTDYDSFRRVVRGDAFDCIVKDADPVAATDVFDAGSGTLTATGTVFVMRKQPVIKDSVDVVYLNGTPLDVSVYVVEYDTTDPETRFSTRAVSCVRIKQKLKATDTVTVSYQFCQACVGIQYNVFGTSAGTDFFGADCLVRLAEPVDIEVGVVIRAGVGVGSDSLSGINAATMSAVAASVSEFFANAAFSESALVPDQLVAHIQGRFSSIRQLWVTRFRRADNYVSDVEPVVLKRYEIPQASGASITVSQA